ncbi:hypothetical protein HBH92_134410 [Parastagonospora nodorum]|nr:hypothetical protein HBH50_154370 [Parastagonospora nodorum]KAH4087698.1 hypothetical protein HBH48_136020 [Parastagonospora nodorum]KAH4409575.1 hypothetical protein HBH92_134410 [Parastagonospora nodorum]KAH4433466.1 hypothetical protein HBH93_131310 [Parastagonospora nodorum]KAH4439687.1 hypothetical protein HBH91_176560 [Parastagonospora nodorum]
MHSLVDALWPISCSGVCLHPRFREVLLNHCYASWTWIWSRPSRSSVANRLISKLLYMSIGPW